MEKLNVIIDEETYQQIKKEMCKNNDYFSIEELLYFNAIFNATPKKSYKKQSETK